MITANEEQLLAHTATSFPLPNRVLVIAPHPDDEVFGCGGTAALLRKQGVEVSTIVVTDGALGGANFDGGVCERRVNESKAAAAILGLDAPDFWKLPDRGLDYGEQLISRLTHAIQETAAELVFLPSPADWHPDHQTLAFAGAEAIRRLGGSRMAAFYEVTDALPCPNLINDITAITDLKHEAMLCFQSQLSDQPYVERIAGINRFRAFHLGAQVASAEAFRLIPAIDLGKGLPLLLEGPLTQRRTLGFVAASSDMPLVSVIIRSMDRPTLDEALDSLVMQTYPNIEVVLVNAKGTSHRPVAPEWGRLPIRMIDTGQPVLRSRAANLGLDAANGDYLMFLDDDDWLDADHIQKLISAIKRYPQFKVAYTDVRCVDENRDPLPRKFASSYNAAKLLTGNFIPIHAVLFSRDNLALGCRLDETFDLYEDWDFWLQLARNSEFLHVEGASAVYRITAQGGFGVTADQTLTEPLRRAIYRKWLGKLSDHQITQLTQVIHQDELRNAQISELNDAVALRDRHMAYLEGQVASLNHNIGERTERLTQLNEAVALRDKHMAYLEGQVAALNRTIGERTQEISQLNETMARLNGEVATLKHAVDERDQHVRGLIGSTSWRITRPLRVLSRLARGQHREVAAALRLRVRHHGKRLYRHLPEPYRTNLLHWGFQRLGWLFRGLPRYEQWRGTTASTGGSLALGRQMLTIDEIDPATEAHGRIAIHLHLYYHDLAGEFARYLKNMPFTYDLYVSVASDAGKDACRKAFAGLPRTEALAIERVPNRGRDIAPMFCTFGGELKGYDFVAHLHGKKSLYNNGATEGWRQYLCEGLLGSEQRIRRIFTLLQQDAPCGIVFPQNFWMLPYQANTWLANKAMGAAWCQRLGIHPVPQGYFDVPAGTMFWARTDALMPLFDAGITLDDFAEESGQTDGTFAHCLERLLVLTARKSGYPPGIIRDTTRPRWSSWSFDQYTSRSWQSMLDQLADSAVRLVAFDIFDTLLCRPLLDAESVKAIVAARLDIEDGRRYLELRAMVEGRAREAAGRDIGMNEIYAHLGTLTGWSALELARIRKLEEDIEYASVAARPEAVALFRQALANGRPVALISDMFLSRTVIERMLRDNGITGWDRLFLSNETGIRKDGGMLYDQVLAHYALQPEHMLMIGDNERSDWQIPLDKGTRCLHLLRPVEFARGLPRIQPLIDADEGRRTLDEELTIGLVLQHNFSAVCYPQLDTSSLVEPAPENIGYSLIGPLLVAMSQWLLETAAIDRIDRLYFLSREGQLIRQVFDVWAEGVEGSPKSQYLVVSRRATSVPMIRNFDDILNIARATYFPNTLANFIFERYGVELGIERWTRLSEQQRWNSNSTVEVFDQHIDHLVPFLDAIQGEILAEAQAEHGALRQYLASMGLDAPGRQAVVDVGYGGTIQAYLNHLVSTPVEGYYLMTNRASAKVADTHGVRVRGCYLENVDPSHDAPPLFRHSFELEKLLSSSDAQVVRYELDERNNLMARHRDLSDDETNSASVRAKLQQGVMQYVRDARNIRERLLPGFRPSGDTARKLYEAFIAQPSPREIDMLKEIALDDHYCGRGIVR